MWGEIFLDFLFPPRCGGCGGRGTWFCDACRTGAEKAPVASCGRCGRLTCVSPCPLCLDSDASLDSLVAAVVLEGPVREAVHRMKYGDRPQLAAPLAGLWRDLPGLDLQPVLVPVPMDRRRLRRRGYNQAGELARHLAAARGLLVLDGLERTVATEPQVGRSGDARRQALRGAFRWPGAASPPAVMLVDDVVTTGATLVECGRACRKAGSASVRALALAVG